MGNLVLLLYSILPVFVVSMCIYKKDKNKEPTKLIIKLLFGGILSGIITIISSLLLSISFPFILKEINDLNYLEIILVSFIFAGLVEEICKWIMLYWFGYKSSEYDEPYDILLYGALIGLGFALQENILYVFDGGLSVAILRAVTAVPLHATIGVIMGYHLGNGKKSKSIIIPVLIHGIYDYGFMSNKYGLISYIILIITFIYSNKLIKKVLK